VGLFGLYVSGGWLAYYSNGAGQYCSIPWAMQWVQLGGNAADWSPSNSGNPNPTDIAMYGAIPTSMTEQGQCTLPAGCFGVAVSDGFLTYYSNGTYHYCTIPTGQWHALGCPNKVVFYPGIPSTMTDDGPC
jgi:hypothetical protein